MKETRLPESVCPYCGCILDAATSLTDDDAPSPGDLSACIKCGTFVRFDDELRLVELTDEEFVELPLEARSLLNEVRRTVNRLKG